MHDAAPSSTSSRCDIAIVGGGLAGGLIALALAEKRPALDVRIVEGGERLGGNHLWSFFDADVSPQDRWLVEPLICHRWPGYDVAFPHHRRGFDQPYHSIESERLDAAVRARLPAEAILTGRGVADLSATQVTLIDGAVIEAGGVIDARGVSATDALKLGWQKFVGREVEVPDGHGLTLPVVMDATVDQIDGYRFVYLLPFSPTRVFVEDTYYSDARDIDAAALEARIDRYVADRGWREAAGANDRRIESGALPVVIDGDFDAYWLAGGEGVAKVGARAALFHPTTGYSLPDAVRLAAAIADADDLSGPALAVFAESYARKMWRTRGFYRLLDRMLFRAGAPDERYRVLERFYRLSPGLIGRFYAGRSTMFDKLRVLAGKPPVPFWRAVSLVLRRG